MIRNDFYGNQYKWFVGLVKEVLGGNAVRVRIIGIHHLEDNVRVSDKDLPIAYLLYPIDYTNAHSIKVDTWVCGFFLDGDNCQQPIVTGILTGGGLTGNAGNNSNQFQCGTGFNANLVGNATEQKIWNFLYNNFQQAGALDPAAATAGIMGNLYQESRLDPNAGTSDWASDANSGEQSFGLAQWNKEAGRFQKLLNFAKENGGSAEDWRRLDVQLKFLWKELVEDYSGVFLELKKSTDPTRAAIAFYEYEKFKGWNDSTRTNKTAKYEVREGQARLYYKKYGNSTQPPPPSSTSSGVSDTPIAGAADRTTNPAVVLGTPSS